MINGAKVGGMNAPQALKKFKTLSLKNEVSINGEVIINGKNTRAHFTNHDITAVKDLLKKQRTWWPSSKVKNLALIPKSSDNYREKVLKNEVSAKLQQLNKKRKAPKDAQATLKNGKLVITRPVNGNKFDIPAMMKRYEAHQYDSQIDLKAIRLKPLDPKSRTVTAEKKLLQNLQKQTVAYKVQSQSYPFAAADFIQDASVSRSMKLSINDRQVKAKLSEINQKQSTLNKNFTFKTHAGSTISVKGQSYGWALHVPAEAKRIITALEKGKKSIKAYNVYGLGFSTYGVGYHNQSSNNIGNTYAEVSIKEQKIWLYRNGRLVLSTNVVTGRHDTHEDTPTGVWYIEYKQSPSTLEGSEAGNANYKVKVKYWAPFTLGGCGFHDAPWRHNWASNAYLTQGSGGCINTPPGVMKEVYDNLSQNEPVIIY